MSTPYLCPPLASCPEDLGVASGWEKAEVDPPGPKRHSTWHTDPSQGHMPSWESLVQGPGQVAHIPAGGPL